MLVPNDIRAIQACIHDLNFVVENYGYLAARDPNERVQLGVGDTTRGIFDVEMGLCDNVLKPNKLPEHIKLCMFIAWDGFSGDPIYPVGGEDEYESGEYRNLYQNRDRKALALHCVKYLSRLLEL